MSLGLEMKFSRIGNRLVVAVDGDLDVHTAPPPRRVLADLIEDQGNLFVDLDLSSVEFLDAAAVRVLVNQRMTLEARGGIFALAGVHPLCIACSRPPGLPATSRSARRTQRDE